MVGGLHVTEYQFFYELMFGDGFWIAMFLLIAIGSYVSSRVKFSGILFVILYFFLSLEYLDSLDPSVRIWGVIAMIFAAIFSAYRATADFKK